MARTCFSIAVAVAGLSIAGCSQPGDKAGSAPPAANTPKQNIVVKGSETMLPLAKAWAQAFMSSHPAITVTVEGGGSNPAIAGLKAKQLDVVNASRSMTNAEIEGAKRDGLNPQEFVVARDPLSIVVNLSNPIRELTMQQIADIYRGKTTNWRQVGGLNKPIVLHGRDSSSGTMQFLQVRVLAGQPFAKGVVTSPTPDALVEAVANDATAIGYASSTNIGDRVKPVAIKKDPTYSPVVGTAESVLIDTYPLSRPLLEYTPGEPAGASKEWLDWVRGPEGQAIVTKLGFAPFK